MKFLIDEDLPRSASEVIQRYGFEAVHVQDIGLRGAKDSQIAHYARSNKLSLLTGDFDFSDVRNYPPSQYAGLVIVSVPSDATAQLILHLKLVIVEPGRIRIRKD